MSSTAAEQHRLAMKRAIEQLNRGDWAASEQTLQTLSWRGDVNAHNVYARIELARGNPAAAIALLLEAIQIAPLQSVLHFNLGNAYRKDGNLAASCNAYARTLELDARNANAHFNLGLSQSTLGHNAAAARSFYLAHRADPKFDDAAHQCVQALAAHARAQPAAAAAPRTIATPATRATFSVVICSINPEKFRRIEQRYRALIPANQLQLIGIHDARGLAEAYNRGIAQSTGEILIFSHDDIEILNDDFADVVANHLLEFDAIGVAGTTHLLGPAVFWAGNPYSQCWVTQKAPAESRYTACVNALSMRHAASAQALDGVLIAVRRDVAQKLPFDERALGFHLYDVEFSYALYRQGYALGVVSDIRLVHESVGNFDQRWQAAAASFLQRHPELNAPQGRSFLFTAKLDTAMQVTHFYNLLGQLEQCWETRGEDWDKITPPSATA